MTPADTEIVLVLTTAPPDFDVEGLARRLLDARLAACVNILPPMRSIYRWQGAVEAADERQVVIKTRRECVPALEAMFTASHPYDVPEWLVLLASGGSDAYLAWVRGEALPPDGEPTTRG